MMPKEGDNSKSPKRKLPNFDPRRFTEHLNRFLPVQVIQDGEKISELFLPEPEVTGKSQDEIKAMAARIYGVFEWARGIINPDKLRQSAQQDFIISGIATYTAGMITANVLDIYFTRAKREGPESFTFTIDADSEPTSKEAKDRALFAHISQGIKLRSYAVGLRV